MGYSVQVVWRDLYLLMWAWLGINFFLSWTCNLVVSVKLYTYMREHRKTWLWKDMKIQNYLLGIIMWMVLRNLGLGISYQP